MRRALDFVTEFIGSGHVDTEKIITKQRLQSSGYTIPHHEFLRSLLHGDGVYYDPQHSPIPNLFQLDRPDPRCHFLLQIALDFISRGEGAREQGGFVDVDVLMSHLQGLGFQFESILFALEYCSRFRLLEAPLGEASVLSMEKCRITTVGAYSVRRLPQLFAYVDAVSVDTPILDRELNAEIGDTHSLLGRIRRAKAFQKYLDVSWDAAGIPGAVWDWSTVSEELKKDIQRVETRI